MARHLHDMGHRRIGFIGGNGARDTRGADRQRGFLAELAAMELENDRVVADLDPPITMREGAEAMNRMLDRWPDTTAVMCVSDLSAFGAMNAALRRGLKVPQEIAVAGFGAYDVSEHALPGITTVDAHAHRIGKEAARVILGALNGGEAEDSVTLQVELLARSSTNTTAGE